jgi:hypothetical protein
MTARYSENFSGKTKHTLKRPSEVTYTENNRGGMDAVEMNHFLRKDWRSNYKMTHHGENVIDDNLILVLQQ